MAIKITANYVAISGEIIGPSCTLPNTIIKIIKTTVVMALREMSWIGVNN